MPVFRRPEIFVSATSADLRSCRQLIKEALLTLRCVPVEQTNFAPDYRDVREMLRARIASCDAVIHLAGEVYGAEPQERARDAPRRSYTQLEYDLARELGKPIYVFVCGPAFLYDVHVAEDPERAQLQQAHRAVLSGSETLHYDVQTREELALRVRELQTHVEHLHSELHRARSWLGRGLAVALILTPVFAAGLWWLRIRANETAAQVAAQKDEIAELRARLAKQSEVTEAVLAKLARANIQPPQELSRDPTLVAQADVAAQRGIDVDELRKQLSTEGSEIRGVLESVEQWRRSATSPNEELVNLQREALLQLSQTELAAARYEAAVAALESALRLTSKSVSPVQWAKLQDRLGTARNSWAAVSTGREISERRAKAIVSFRAALEVYTRAAFSNEWARSQNNLAEALVRHALSGPSADRLRLLTEAVLACRAALEVYDQDTMPEDWARTQNNLADALVRQAVSTTSTDRARLFRLAVSAYRAALAVFTRATLPEEWGRTQTKLATALVYEASSASSLERAGLLREAVTACRAALEVLTRETLPRDWALTQYGLAIALANQAPAMGGADGANLFKEAVECFRAALEVFDLEAMPQEWARAQTDLAITLRRQVSTSASADRLRLLAEIVGAYRSALVIYTREALPQDWGRTQNNIAVALMALADASSSADRERIMMDAVAASRASLEVITRDSNVELWAIQKWTLGDALGRLADETPQNGRLALLTEALTAHRDALEIFTSDAFPAQHADLAKEVIAAESKLAAAKGIGK